MRCCARACAAISTATCARPGWCTQASRLPRTTARSSRCRTGTARRSDSEWLASAQAYWQPSDYVVVSLGGAADADEAVADRLDAQRRLRLRAARRRLSRPLVLAVHRQRDDHQHRGAHAALGHALELSRRSRGSACATRCSSREMEHSDQIRFEDGFTAGKPRLAGLRFSIEPAPGWSLSANRLMQFGGGERGGDSFGDFLDALFKPHQNDNRSDGSARTRSSATRSPRGPAASSSRGARRSPPISSTPAKTPPTKATTAWATRRCRSASRSRDCGSASISRTKRSEWQNGWYAHGIYLDGMTNDGRVLGHWGADRRVFDRRASARRRTCCASAGSRPSAADLQCAGAHRRQRKLRPRSTTSAAMTWR